MTLTPRRGARRSPHHRKSRLLRLTAALVFALPGIDAGATTPAAEWLSPLRFSR